jgi:hypothetical protein
MLNLFARMTARDSPQPPLPIQDRPEARVTAVSVHPKKVRAKRSAPPPEAPVAPDDESALALLRQQIFVAAEAERKLGIALKALLQISEGAKNPDRLAAAVLAQLVKEKP